MEISILLAEQIIAMFLTMAVGFGVVRAGLFKTEDSRIISNMVVYICNPCVVVHAFQIELTDDKIKGLMIAVGTEAPEMFLSGANAFFDAFATV